MSSYLSKLYEFAQSAQDAYETVRDVVTFKDRHVEGLYLPSVADLAILEKRLESENVKFCDVFSVVMAGLSPEEKAKYLESKSQSSSMFAQRFIFPKVKQAVEEMMAVFKESTEQSCTIVFVCADYRALKFAGVSHITYMFPSAQFIASVQEQKSDSSFASAASVGPLAPSVPAPYQAPPFDPIAFAAEREDILKRKKDKVKIFNSVQELIDMCAEHYEVQVKI